MAEGNTALLRSRSVHSAISAARVTAVVEAAARVARVWLTRRRRAASTGTRVAATVPAVRFARTAGAASAGAREAAVVDAARAAGARHARARLSAFVVAGRAARPAHPAAATGARAAAVVLAGRRAHTVRDTAGPAGARAAAVVSAVEVARAVRDARAGVVARVEPVHACAVRDARWAAPAGARLAAAVLAARAARSVGDAGTCISARVVAVLARAVGDARWACAAGASVAAVVETARAAPVRHARRAAPARALVAATVEAGGAANAVRHTLWARSVWLALHRAAAASAGVAAEIDAADRIAVAPAKLARIGPRVSDPHPARRDDDGDEGKDACATSRHVQIHHTALATRTARRPSQDAATCLSCEPSPAIAERLFVEAAPAVAVVPEEDRIIEAVHLYGERRHILAEDEHRLERLLRQIPGGDVRREPGGVDRVV